MDDLQVLASDLDRERVADLLREHCTAGRLTLDEFDERLGEVYASRTLADLERPLRQLPALEWDQPDPEPHVPTWDRLNDRFKKHVTVCAVLVVVWAMSGAGYFWAGWPIFWIMFGAFKRGIWKDPEPEAEPEAAPGV